MREPKNVAAKAEALSLLGLKYHYYTECFDRAHCSGASPYTGDALPVTPHQRALIDRNARKQLAEALREGSQLGYSASEVRASISEAAHYSFEELEILVERVERGN